jgi:hypothetical protein
MENFPRFPNFNSKCWHYGILQFWSFITLNWHAPKLLDKFKCERWTHQNSKELRHVHWLVALWGKRGVLELRDGDYEKWQASITHTNLQKLNNKLVNAYFEHFWCTNEPRANMDSQDSPQPGLEGSHHLPPNSILCAWPHD